MSLKRSTRLKTSDQKTFWSGRPTNPFSASFKAYNSRRVRMPMMQQPEQPGTCVLFLTTAGSSLSGESPPNGPGLGLQAWAALWEKFDGSSRGALRAEHHKLNHTKMTPGLYPDEVFYMMESCRDCLNAGSMRIFYYKPCRWGTKESGKPVSKDGTSVLPIFVE